MVAAAWVGGVWPRAHATRERGIDGLPGDIQVGVPEFDRRWRLESPGGDPRHVRAVLGGDVTHAAAAADPGVAEFWCENGWLFTAWNGQYGKARFGTVDEVTARLEFLHTVAAAWPMEFRAGPGVRGPRGDALDAAAVRDLFPNLRVPVL